jgi:hypothetical protein
MFWQRTSILRSLAVGFEEVVKEDDGTITAVTKVKGQPFGRDYGQVQKQATFRGRGWV